MKSISYFSQICFAEYSFNTINDILTVAEANNKKSRITGCLLYSFPFFYQYIEGEEDSINRLWKNISKDSRHKDVILVSEEKTTRRLFSNWSMKFKNLSHFSFIKHGMHCRLEKSFSRLRSDHRRNGDIMIQTLLAHVQDTEKVSILKDLKSSVLFKSPYYSFLIDRENDKPLYASPDAYQYLTRSTDYIFVGKKGTDQKKLYFKDIFENKYEAYPLDAAGKPENFSIFFSEASGKRFLSIKPEKDYEKSAFECRLIVDAKDGKCTFLDQDVMSDKDSAFFKTGYPQSIDDFMDHFGTFANYELDRCMSQVAQIGTGVIQQFTGYAGDQRKELILRVFPLCNKEAEVCFFEIEILECMLDRNNKELNKNTYKEQQAGVDDSLDFVANLSHEIRSPLHAILGLIDSITDDEVSPQVSQKLNKAKQSGKTLRSLINNVLDWTKINSGAIKIEPQDNDLRKVVRYVCDTFSFHPLLKGAGIKLVVSNDLPQYLLFDELKLTQIIQNLISNACKFSNQKDVFVTIASRKKGELYEIRITVKDQGIGISPDKLQSVFEPFVQLTNDGEGNQKGTGLGLAISSNIASAMNGQLSVRSRVGQGSSFSLTVPLVEASDFERPVDKSIKGSAIKNLRVLIVDDSDLNLVILEKMLNGMVKSIDQAHDGFEAVEKTNDFEYDVAFMDISMPGIDGFEAIRQIQRRSCDNKAMKEPKFVMLSANATNKARNYAESLGVSSFLAKPFDKNSIRQELEKAVL